MIILLLKSSNNAVDCSTMNDATPSRGKNRTTFMFKHIGRVFSLTD